MTDGIYPEWKPRRFNVELIDPDQTHRVVIIAAAIGPWDATSQAEYVWPLSKVVKAQEVTDGD